MVFLQSSDGVVLEVPPAVVERSVQLQMLIEGADEEEQRTAVLDSEFDSSVLRLFFEAVASDSGSTLRATPATVVAVTNAASYYFVPHVERRCIDTIRATIEQVPECCLGRCLACDSVYVCGDPWECPHNK